MEFLNVVFFVSKSLLGIEGQRKLEKFTILTRKPRSHARILIYRTGTIVTRSLALSRASRSVQLLAITLSFELIHCIGCVLFDWLLEIDYFDSGPTTPNIENRSINQLYCLCYL